MEIMPMLMMFISIVLAWYLKIYWLAGLMGAAWVFMLLSTISFNLPKPSAKAVPTGAPQEKEEILSPVIVTDVGQSPWLYPPNFRIRVKPNWHANNWIENGGRGLGAMMFGIGALSQSRAILPRGQWSMFRNPWMKPGW